MIDNGIEMLKSEGYVGFKKYLKSEKKNSESFVSKPCFFIPATVVLSGVDGIVLYGLTNISMQQNAIMGYLMAFTVALILNVIPLIMAQYIHHFIYKTRRYALIAASICLMVFIALFSTTINLRYQYKDIYGEGSVEQIINQVIVGDSDEEIKEVITPEDKKAAAVFWLLAIEPLATSVMNLFLGLMGDNTLKKHIYELRIRRIELYEAKSDCEAALADMNRDIERMINIDYEKSLVMKDKIHALQKTLKAVSRQILAEELGDPTSISMLCGNNTQDEVVGEKASVLPDFSNKEVSKDFIYSLSA